MPIKVVHAMVAGVVAVNHNMVSITHLEPPRLGIVARGCPAGEFEHRPRGRKLSRNVLKNRGTR